ncbi:hypothetical protein OU591_27190, partial [Escherichia coli]|nr:hypothetical protein [Escherichia coli]MDF8529014.1 hypothetical protein [Escherichia coli]
SFWMVTLKAHILPHHDLQPPGCRGSGCTLTLYLSCFGSRTSLSVALLIVIRMMVFILMV